MIKRTAIMMVLAISASVPAARAGGVLMCNSSEVPVCVAPGGSCDRHRPVHACKDQPHIASEPAGTSQCDSLFVPPEAACKGKNFDEECLREEGVLGHCGVTPLTAGGFCMCYAND
jgi:hypothetical protein